MGVDEQINLGGADISVPYCICNETNTERAYYFQSSIRWQNVKCLKCPRILTAMAGQLLACPVPSLWWSYVSQAHLGLGRRGVLYILTDITMWV